MRVGIVGIGVVGSRVARLCLDEPGVESVVLLGGSPKQQQQLCDELGPRCVSEPGGDVRLVPPTRSTNLSVPDTGALGRNNVDVVIACVPDDHQVAAAQWAIAGGAHVVTLADGRETVRSLLECHDHALEAGRAVVAGAGASPGLALLLALHAVSLYSEVHAISIGIVGTAGPECLSRCTRALKSECMEWRESEWVHYVGSPGTELLWFPDPIGAVDCGRGDFSATSLLRRSLPAVGSISVKAATPVRAGLRRRLRRGTPPVDLGALRVEVHGRGVVPETRQPVASDLLSSTVYGIVAPMDLCSASLAVSAAVAVTEKSARGAGGIDEFVDPVDAFRALERHGMTPVVYEGLA